MPVYKDDYFEYQYGTNEKLNHVPAQVTKGEPIGYYAFYKLTNGGVHFVYWSRQKCKCTKTDTHVVVAFGITILTLWH